MSRERTLPRQRNYSSRSNPPRGRGLPAFALLLAASLNASAQFQVKEHQATGSVASATPTQIVLLKTFGKNETKWTFVVNLKTKIEAKPTKGQRIRISYHEEKGVRIADRIRGAATSQSSAAATAPKSSPAPADAAGRGQADSPPK